MSYGHTPPPGQPYGSPYGAPQPYGQQPPQGFPPGAPPQQQYQPGPGQPPPGYGPQDSFRPPLPPPPGVPTFRKPPLPVSSTPDIPGATIGKLIGDVTGVAIRPKGPPNPALATGTRQDAVAAMAQMADAAGADAVVGWRFETVDLGPVIEVVAYGTAVTLRPARAITTPDDRDDVLMVDDADEQFDLPVKSPSSPAHSATQPATPTSATEAAEAAEAPSFGEHPESSLEVTAPFTPPGMDQPASTEPASSASSATPSWSDEAAPDWSTESTEHSPWAPPSAPAPAPAPRPEPGAWPFQSADQSAPQPPPYGQQPAEPYGQQPQQPYGQQPAPPYGQQPQSPYGPPHTDEGIR